MIFPCIRWYFIFFSESHKVWFLIMERRPGKKKLSKNLLEMKVKSALYFHSTFWIDFPSSWNVPKKRRRRWKKKKSEPGCLKEKLVEQWEMELPGSLWSQVMSILRISDLEGWPSKVGFIFLLYTDFLWFKMYRNEQRNWIFDGRTCCRYGWR